MYVLTMFSLEGCYCCTVYMHMYMVIYAISCMKVEMLKTTLMAIVRIANWEIRFTG